MRWRAGSGYFEDTRILHTRLVGVFQLASHRFRQFSNLSFLISLDIAKSVIPLLAKHRHHFATQGFDIDELSTVEAPARQLLSMLTTSVERLPGDLLNALYLVDELGDEEGCQRILEEAEKTQVNLPVLPDNISQGDFAILVLLEHPDLIRRCREKTVTRRVKRFYEFGSADPRRFKLSDIESAVEPIRSDLGPWFKARRRTETCEVFVYQEGDEVRALITHGGLFRADGNITEQLELSRLPWRPQKHDSVIYDTRTGVLKIYATYEKERLRYRESIGRALVGDAAFFVASPTYSFERLRSLSGSLRLVEGLDRARLTEAAVETESANCRLAEFKGDDLMEIVAGRDATAFPLGEIVRVRFALHFRSGGKARPVELRLPNIAEYDREREGDVTEAFIRANELISASEDDGALVGAA